MCMILSLSFNANDSILIYGIFDEMQTKNKNIDEI